MNRRAFTLIEVLVVVAIITILISLLVPAVQRVRERAAGAQTHNHLMQLALAVHACNDIHGKVPPATGWFGAIPSPKLATVGGVPATIHVHLLPFIEQDNLYRVLVRGKVGLGQPPAGVEAAPGGAPAAGPAGAGAAPGPGGADAPKPGITETAVSLYVSPADPMAPADGKGVTSFAANLRLFSDLGLDTKWDAPIRPAAGGRNPRTGVPWYYGSASLPDSIPDGESNTIAFTTKYAHCAGESTFFVNSAAQEKHSPFFAFYAPKHPASRGVGRNIDAGNAPQHDIFQIAPTDADCDPSYTPQSLGMLTISVGLADGSARLVKTTISPRTWGLAVQPNDALVLPADWN